jgi:pimeloyl-ACP methyl ester carboxylesterase
VRRFVFLCVLPLAAGCLSFRGSREACRPVTYTVQRPVGVVFVANGSGDFQTVSNNLEQVFEESSTPLEINTFTWSHGYGRYAWDHIDHCNHLAQGRCLASEIAAYRQANPGRRIFLIGHSAGCAVVLEAVNLLPSGTIDRIVLLAPSVSDAYDLRPALLASRLGIDVFHSGRDNFILGACMLIVGTADGASRTAAGRCGFTPIITSPADAALYTKLRQHPWDETVEWTGHSGGHYGSNNAEFLRAYVLPLLKD